MSWLSLKGSQKQLIKCTLHLDEQPNDYTKDCGMDHFVAATKKRPTTSKMTLKPEVVFSWTYIKAKSIKLFINKCSKNSGNYICIFRSRFLRPGSLFCMFKINELTIDQKTVFLRVCSSILGKAIAWELETIDHLAAFFFLVHTLKMNAVYFQQLSMVKNDKNYTVYNRILAYEL